MAAASFMAGWAIDMDHVLDYLVEFGARSDWRNFFRSFYDSQYTRIYILFHAWEWLAVLAAAAMLSGWNPWATGLLLGATHHMILDQLSNGVSAAGYSLLWRLSVGFAPDPAFPYKKKRFKSRRARRQGT